MLLRTEYQVWFVLYHRSAVNALYLFLYFIYGDQFLLEKLKTYAKFKYVVGKEKRNMQIPKVIRVTKQTIRTNKIKQE